MWPTKEGDARGIKVKSGVKKIKGSNAHSHVEIETNSGQLESYYRRFQ